MRDMKRAAQKGFTLIELMIVIAIVAILVALAVPAYQDYTIRAKIGECVNGAAVAKLQISEYAETTGSWPADENTAGTVSPAGETIKCDGWGFAGNTGTFNVEIHEVNVGVPGNNTVEPSMVGTKAASGMVQWRCTRGTTGAAELKYLPATCRGT